MKEDFSEFSNHSIIELSVDHTESCRLMMSFIEDVLHTPRSKQRLRLQFNEEKDGGTGTLSYKFDNQVREVGRFLSPKYGVLPTVIIIKNYVKERFKDYLVANKVEWNELII